MTAIGETLASSVTGNKSSTNKRVPSAAEFGSNCRPGIVTIIDIQNVNDVQVIEMMNCDYDDTHIFMLGGIQFCLNLIFRIVIDSLVD